MLTTIIIAVAIILVIMLIIGKAETGQLYGSYLNTKFASPLSTALVLRNDTQGLGHFGASRGSRKHAGIDFVANPGAAVFAPIGGTTRKLQVYSGNPTWTGVAIKNADYEVKLFYVAPLGNLPARVQRGERLGSMQNRAAGNSSMKNHIHVEVWVKGKQVDPASFFTYTM